MDFGKTEVSEIASFLYLDLITDTQSLFLFIRLCFVGSSSSQFLGCSSGSLWSLAMSQPAALRGLGPTDSQEMPQGNISYTISKWISVLLV